MQYLSAKPSPLLAPYVSQYWAMENCIPDGKVHIQRLVPTGMPDLTFYFHSKPIALNTHRSFTEVSVITGQQKDYYDLSLSHKTSLFAIIFQPFGLSLLLNVPVNELFNHTASLRDLAKNVEVNKLEDLLFEASTFKNRVAIAEAFLGQLLQKQQKQFHIPRIRKSIELINASRGIISLDKLAATACFSRKQYERVFSALLGITPSNFSGLSGFKMRSVKKQGKARLILLHSLICVDIMIRRI